MTLKDQLRARIGQTGPITVAEYMADCLFHPEFGYYATRDPLGAAGDFTTAPEISQMFGELIGLSLAQAWIDQGCPAPFVLAELGPGRGTLMADALRAVKAVPGFHDAMQVWLIEASPVLQGLQSDVLAGFGARWSKTVEDLPDLPLFFVANEFFDALPVRQFQRVGDGWAERMIGVQDGALRFGLAAAGSQPVLAHRLEDTQDGDLVELCAPAPAIVETLAHRIANFGGAGVIVDYGDWRAQGDTLQALRAHQPVDPLLCPGEADLTCHVDFEPLAMTARSAGCAHSRVTPQGVFLERLGITQRAQVLAGSLQGKPLEALVQAHRRLTHPAEMGNLFKVLGLFPAQGKPPSGLVA